MFGIEFHYFHETDSREKQGLRFIPCQGSLNQGQLERAIIYLKKSYDLLGARDFMDAVLRGDDRKDRVCLTFDDGLKSQAEIAWPVMESLGVTGFFFTCTSWMENRPLLLEVYHDFRFREYSTVSQFYGGFFEIMRKNAHLLSPEVFEQMRLFRHEDYLIHCPWHSYDDKLFRYTRDRLLTEEQYHLLMHILMSEKGYNPQEHLKDLWISGDQLCALQSAGNVIGLHSHTHPTTMTYMSYAQQFMEYAKNQNMLESVLGQRPDTVSYPCDACSAETEDIMHRLNVRLGFAAHVTAERNPLRISRRNHPLLVEEMSETGYF